MAPDIRSFFGGGGGRASDAPVKKETKGALPAKKQRARKVVADDSDEEVIETKPKKTKKEVTPAPVEETTSSEYFASKGKAKPSRSTPLRPKQNGTNSTAATPSRAVNESAPSTGRQSAGKSVKKPYGDNEENEVVMLDDDKEGDDDIFADDFKTMGKKAADDYEEDSDDEVLLPKKRKPASKKATTTNGHKKKAALEDEDGDIEMAEIPVHDGGADPKRKRGSIASSTASTRKRKSKSVEDEEDEDDDFLDKDEPQKKKPRKTPTKSTPTKPRTKKEPKEESKDIQAIFDSIETVRAPTPPPRDPDDKKFKFNGGNTTAAPTDPGSLELPSGAENCLAGLTFVFTGVLESLGRDEGIELVKRYGGKVTTAPSSKTSFVVIGNDAGPSKLEKIRKMGIKTVKEKGLFQLINTLPANGGDGVAAEKYAEKKAADEEKIRKAAEEIEQKEKARAKQARLAQNAAATATGPGSALKAAQLKKLNNDDRLWVDKYAPDSLNSVAGNKGQVEKLQKWLRAWHNNAKFGFKKAGSDGNGIYRAAMLSGPPGIGKTTAAHLVAKLEGFDVVETNASDTRSKKLMEASLRGVLDTTSLLGFFAGEGKKVEGVKKKLLLIMDEVDGMSAGDRGGVGALAAVAKKTKIPMILICNERRLPKMKPFDFIMADFKFIRPTTEQIRSRILTILFREKMKIPPAVIDALIEGSHADIRQVINMISTAKLDEQTMDFNDGKAMAKAWEKHIILKPWDIVGKILRPQMFAASSNTTLNEKIELYFNDHEFSSLMLQENYLKTQPSLLNGITNPKEKRLRALELAENAANAISEGDLVDRMIHGTQQQWSLMPTHAVFSFVAPASYVYGNFTERSGFTSWLGMNSKQGKLARFVKEIQGHMRLKASGDRHEVRQQYFPALWNKTFKALQADGKEAVQDVIDFMDSYYLTKDDYDAIVELGVGPMDMDHQQVKLETATKATFTRLYNSQSHPLPFIKASSVGNPIGGKSRKEKPDLEEAVDESEDEAMGAEAVEFDDEEDGEIDLKKDKYIAKPKKKKAAATKGKGKGKGKAKDDENDDDSEEPEDVAPKKKKAAGRGRGK